LSVAKLTLIHGRSCHLEKLFMIKRLYYLEYHLTSILQ